CQTRGARRFGRLWARPVSVPHGSNSMGKGPFRGRKSIRFPRDLDASAGLAHRDQFFRKNVNEMPFCVAKVPELTRFHELFPPPGPAFDVSVPDSGFGTNMDGYHGE